MGTLQPSLLFEPRDLVLQLGIHSQFSVTSSLPLNQSTEVEFYCDSDQDVISFKKQTISIDANDTTWHPVDILAHAVKFDFFVKANCSRAFIEFCPFNLTDSFVHLTSVHSIPLNVVIIVFGWIYFAAWSFSFYPQIYLNFRRKSVFGLNFDFLVLNITGFLFYGLYNVSLFWIPIVKEEYVQRYPAKVLPVLLNDVVFALHAFFACLITALQCFIYERGRQTISSTAIGLTASLWSAALVSLIIALSTSWMLWIDFFNVLSYIKLVITLIKYVPQALYNYRRKSTVGWSIGNILLDFTGGSMSLLQMILIAYNNETFGEFFANFSKFGLGFVSLLFDLLFMFQHYVLYKDTGDLGSALVDEDHSHESEADPDESQSNSESVAHAIAT